MTELEQWKRFVLSLPNLPIMSNKTYSETKFAEHVYHSFHGCLVSNCNWWQIQEPIQTNGNWLARTDWIILHRLTKVDHTLTSDSGILSLRSYHWKTRFKHQIWIFTRHSTKKKTVYWVWVLGKTQTQTRIWIQNLILFILV